MDFQAGCTRNGAPAFWETRKDSTFLTVVEMIATHELKPKKTIFVNNGTTDLPKSSHAIFVAKVTDIILRVVRTNKGKITYEIYAVIGFDEVGPQKFTLHTEFITKSESIDSILEEFATAENEKDFRAFLEAGRDKLDNDKLMSCYYVIEQTNN